MGVRERGVGVRGWSGSEGGVGVRVRGVGVRGEWE